LCSFAVRFLLFPLPGAEGDLYYFAQWFHAAADHGPRVFYNVVTSYNVLFCDYPPFNVYLFWIFGSLAKSLSLFGTALINYVIKLLPTLFDIATVFLIFAFVRKRFDFKTSLVTAALYAFNPAVIFDSAVWGQVDAIYTFFLLLSLMLLLDSKPKLSVVAFTVAILTKPQSIALAPLIFFLIFRKHGWRNLLTSLLTAAATVFVVILPFEWSNPITFLSDIYFGALGGWTYTTMNAFNIWALGGMWVADTQIFITLGWVMFALLTIFTLYVLHERLDTSGELLILFAAFMLFFSFFMFPTRMHERYLFPALSVLALMLPFSKKIRPIYAALTFTCFVNMAYVLSFNNAGQFIQFGDPVVWVVTLINLIVFIYAFTLMYKEFARKNSQRSDKNQLEG